MDVIVPMYHIEYNDIINIKVMKAMMDELQASGLSQEEILEKAQILMKAFGKEDAGSTAEYKLLRLEYNISLEW